MNNYRKFNVFSIILFSEVNFYVLWLKHNRYNGLCFARATDLRVKKILPIAHYYKSNDEIVGLDRPGASQVLVYRDSCLAIVYPSFCNA